MNKFRSKVECKSDKNAEYLIKAFFQDFNAQSSFFLKGEQAELEVFFEKPPMNIVKAITHCKVIELRYNGNEKTLLKDESDELQDTEQVVFSRGTKQENKSEAKKRYKKDTNKSTKNKVNSKQQSNETNITNIPHLEEIAKKATSFEDFAKLVIEWLDLGKRQEYFKNLLIASVRLDTSTLKDLNEELRNKNISFTDWDVTWCRRRISEKIQGKSAKLFNLLNIIREYKEYSFGQVENVSGNDSSTLEREKVKTENFKENVTNVDESTKDTDETTLVANEGLEETTKESNLKPRVKMECMPEIKSFEETLASVDMSKTVEERVSYVLNAMGLEEQPIEYQKRIVHFVSRAICIRKMEIDTIFINVQIPVEELEIVRMTLSKLINNFVQKYEKGKKVKLLTFLSELQKIIMHEYEIESFSEFAK